MSEQDQLILALIEHLRKKLLLIPHSNDIDTPNDDECTKKLIENRYKLIHTMCQTAKVMDYLESNGVIPRSICSRILHEYRVPEDRNRALLDFLFSRATNAFRPLIEALYLSGNEHLVQLLDEKFLLSNVRQQIDAEYRFPTAVGLHVSLPTSVEDEKLRNFNNNIESLESQISLFNLNDVEITKFDDEVQMGFEVQLLTSDLLEQYPQLDPMQRSNKCYRMLRRPRGQCLLINNVDAFKTMEIRQGSDIDASKLKSLYEQLGFVVVVRRNLIHKEMVNVIKNFADLIEEQKETCDCAVIIILSHGGNGTIYAVDELALDVDEQIISVFDDHLIGKPKLFILQACRGSQCNYRSESSTRLWSTDSIINETNIDSGSHVITKVPKRSDMAIWYSTLKDYVSWRLPDEGSVFIQSLITVFARTAWHYDLVTMVQCVNRTMKEKFAAHESTPFQTPCFEYHLDYPLYFNPGCFDQN
ncbi:unnamed protein product [Rotaria magnacalcarata]|uniref:Caspase-8 n=4 Tax=Rotaria magnacalcarata TaxID=392030 RepID=A0A815YQE4_9BILA|nr:unnamed protein product [Rotaria magnacalcarata]CAF1657352.1 unnamed protein product [Rotaria magnacalcarata]CAF2035216.1 unnamed protein product [Rotaria magnacalcarata]CAF2073563.1 unnamed protein product [Rotaria magnacalcarata]CAF2078549.1 unnamed protein product [Rotaria magnacalcarata]